MSVKLDSVFTEFSQNFEWNLKSTFHTYSLRSLDLIGLFAKVRLFLAGENLVNSFSIEAGNARLKLFNLVDKGLGS